MAVGWSTSCCLRYPWEYGMTSMPSAPKWSLKEISSAPRTAPPLGSDLDDDDTGTVGGTARETASGFVGKFSPHVASKEAGDEAGGARATFDPHAMHFAQHGSRAARFGITVEHHSKGSGRTVFPMNNNLMDHHGAYDKVATWERRGWAAKTRRTLSFRDDTNEQYAFHSVTVRCKSCRPGARGSLTLSSGDV